MCILSKKNKAKIGKNSIGNTIYQDNTFYVGQSLSDTIEILSKQKKYDVIQEIALSNLKPIHESHPLYPFYSVSVDSSINKLISTPKTDEALKKYPKRITGTLHINYEDYPYMRKDESPLDYAYRTQTTLKIPTTNVKEYLGDIEDPYPTITDNEKVQTVIQPPEFPAASLIKVCSGNVSIPVLVRRQPCFEYGNLLIVSEPENDVGFNLSITLNADRTKSSFTLDKVKDCSLHTHLEREKLIEQISKTKQVSITISGKEVLHSTIEETELQKPFFSQAHLVVGFLQNLIEIQNCLHCVFSYPDSVTIDEYQWVRLISASIRNEWARKKNNFEEGRSDYRNLEELLTKNPNGVFKHIATEVERDNIILFGICFKGVLKIIYQDVKINNIESVQKHINKKKNNILVTFKPIDGNDSFDVFYKLENISYEECDKESFEELSESIAD